jgi:hypothetical protein
MISNKMAGPPNEPPNPRVWKGEPNNIGTSVFANVDAAELLYYHTQKIKQRTTTSFLEPKSQKNLESPKTTVLY